MSRKLKICYIVPNMDSKDGWGRISSDIVKAIKDICEQRINTLTRKCEMLTYVLYSSCVVVCARIRVYALRLFWQAVMATDVVSTWSISSRRRNAEASWASGNPSRLSISDRVWLFVVIKQLRDEPNYGKRAKIINILADEHNVFCSESSVRRALAKYAANGYELDIAAVKFARTAKFPEASQRLILSKLLAGSSARAVVRENRFRDEVKWEGNPAKKIEIIKKAIQKVHVSKSFWRNMYANAAERHLYVRDNSGLIYRKS